MWQTILSVPLIAVLFAVISFTTSDQSSWMRLYYQLFNMHGMLLLPLMAALTVAYLCRFEHEQDNWKQFLSQPLTRWQVYNCKFLLSIMAIGTIQILMFLSFLLLGIVLGVEGEIPFEILLKGVFGGWVATLPLIALQLWVSSAWKSFAGAMTINVIFTIPAILIAQSGDFGPYYPWAQPFLAMFPQQDASSMFYVPFITLFAVIGGSFLLFYIAGIVQFNRRAY